MPAEMNAPPYPALTRWNNWVVCMTTNTWLDRGARQGAS